MLRLIFSSVLFSPAIISSASDFEIFQHALPLQRVESLDLSISARGENEAFERLYSQLAYRDDFCSSESCEDRQKYLWNKPISVHLSVSEAMRHRLALLDKTIQKFARFSSEATNGVLKFSTDDSNVEIYVGDEETLAALRLNLEPDELKFFNRLARLAKDGCFATIQVTDQNIVKSVIFAPGKLSDVELEKCLLEELFHTTGLFGDPEGLPSLFDGFQPHPTYEFFPYTPQMFQFLRFHYLETTR